jgi:hypothetical protein
MFSGYFVFGLEDGNRFDLGLEAQGSATLKARIDARNDASGFVRVVCDFARHLGCVLFVFESEALVEPDVAALTGALANSKAAEFVRDPRGFLARVPDAI